MLCFKLSRLTILVVVCSCSAGDPRPDDSSQYSDDPSAVPTDQAEEPETRCIPDCTDKECGSDGCGGQCGKCNTNALCISGICHKDKPRFAKPCVKDTECESGYCLMGPDGKVCTQSCQVDEDCPEQWLCKERPGTCPDCVFICYWDCTPLCDVKECGSDGCGASCGTCPPGFICLEGNCT